VKTEETKDRGLSSIITHPGIFYEAMNCYITGKDGEVDRERVKRLCGGVVVALSGDREVLGELNAILIGGMGE